MAKVKRIAHIAMLVEGIDRAAAFWHEALGIRPARTEDVLAEGARVAFLPLGECEVELVQPTTRDSGLARYLERRGPGLHHICLEVDDIEGMLAQLTRRGVRLVNEAPQQGAGGRRYAFVHPEATQGVLVELYEAPG